MSPLNKSEIKAHAVHAGHLEPLKPWATESVLQVDKSSKQESPLKICLVAAESAVVWAAMVDSHMRHGPTTRTAVCQQDGCTKPRTGASLTVSHLAITTQLENTSHVEQWSQLPNAKDPAFRAIQPTTKRTFTTQRKSSPSQRTCPRFRRKSWQTALLRHRLTFMRISWLISQEYTTMFRERVWEGTRSRFWDGVLKRAFQIGWWLTAGMKIGERRGFSRSREEKTNAALRPVLLLVFPKCTDWLIKIIGYQYNFDKKLIIKESFKHLIEENDGNDQKIVKKV